MRLSLDGSVTSVPTYIYPVVSRRAKGLSVGVNLNTNNACNWRCAYCQVPNLIRGSAGEIDVEQLEQELTEFLEKVGSYMEGHVPEALRRVNDVAIAGRGEPTTSKQFDAVIRAIARIFIRLDLVGKLKLVLITNGSLIHRANVQSGLAAMAPIGGEVWFKLDSATLEGRTRLNGIRMETSRVADNLRLASRLCRTRIQTMALAMDGQPPSKAEQDAWLELVRQVLEDGAPIQDVLLYGLDRASNQPEAERIEKLPGEWLERFAHRIEGLGLPVHIHG